MSHTVAGLRRLSDTRFELSLESGETLKIALDQVADFSLYPDRELTDAELEELRSAAALSRTKERALRIINARAMSEREMYDRLVEKGESEQNAAAAVAWLLDLHFLNDADYAAAVARHCAAKGYGKRRVRDEFFKRKIPRELWDAAMEEFPVEADGTLDKLLRVRLRGADPDDRAALKRATDALLRRGFGWDEIEAAVERYRAGNQRQ